MFNNYSGGSASKRVFPGSSGGGSGGGGGGSDFWQQKTLTSIELKAPYQDVYISGTLYMTSDKNKKENIVNIDKNDIDNLKQIKAKQYTLKDDVNKEKQFGVIAQELEVHYPNLVKTIENFDDDGNKTSELKSVNYIGLIPLLLEKINSLEKRIEELENK